MKRRDFCKALAGTLAAGALYPGMEAQAAQTETALVGSVVPDDYYTLWYRNDRSEIDSKHSYYYSESLFDHAATEYDNRLALITLGMTIAAFSTNESDSRYWMKGEVGRADSIRDAFAKLGFGEVELFNYDHSLNDTPQTVGCAIARKTLVRNGKRVTLIAAFLRGGGYGAEWSNNFYAGEGSAHRGFVLAAQQISGKIQDYVKRMEKKKSFGTLKCWLGGFSRSAAVANLVAARLPALLPQLSKSRFYVYTFATPVSLTAEDCPELQQNYDNNHRADGTLKNKWGTSNIFNLISSGDIVPRVLPAEWGFHRNGNDRFLPSTQVPEELKALNELAQQLEGKPEIQFDRMATAEETDAVVKSLAELIGSRQNYHAVYEPIFRCMMQCVHTRSEEEVVDGVVLDDEAVVERLCAMDGMKQFSREKIESNVKTASAMYRPFLEQFGDNVPLRVRQMALPLLAVGYCFNMDQDSLMLTATFVVSMLSESGQANDVMRAAMCHFVENYFTLLEYYSPEEHGMEPYTRK